MNEAYKNRKRQESQNGLSAARGKSMQMGRKSEAETKTFRASICWSCSALPRAYSPPSWMVPSPNLASIVVRSSRILDLRESW